MVVNPYSVLAAFVAVLEGILGLAILVAVLRARRRRAPPVSEAAVLSDVIPMLGWSAMVLLGLALASWPLLYLLLQSEVGLWPGVMCIQGVVLVGSESVGTAAWLPWLVLGLQVIKPALVFLAGAWLVLHLVDRATRTAPLRRRLLVVLGLLGSVAVADAAVELTYLAIPKRETGLSAGCCTLHAVAREKPLPGPVLSSMSPRATRHVVLVGHFVLCALMVMGTGLCAGRVGKRTPRWTPGLVLLAALSIPVGAAFLARIAAPALLGRPEHRCPYCVLAEAPESLVGVGLFLLGAFAVGWAAVATWLARHEETRDVLARPVRALFRASQFGYASATLFSAGALAVS